MGTWIHEWICFVFVKFLSNNVNLLISVANNVLPVVLSLNPQYTLFIICRPLLSAGEGLMWTPGHQLPMYGQECVCNPLPPKKEYCPKKKTNINIFKTALIAPFCCFNISALTLQNAMCNAKKDLRKTDAKVEGSIWPLWLFKNNNYNLTFRRLNFTTLAI